MAAGTKDFTGPSPVMTVRTALRWLLAAAFLFAGLVHITRPDVFLRIVPYWVPSPRLTVIATGWCEIAGAIGLWVPRLRWWAGTMLALYVVCVYPANIKHALDYGHAYGFGRGWLYHGPRLLFQPVIAWWCLYAAGVIDWPFTGQDQAAPRPPRPR
jgi:uncharacterized membrane protein